MPVNYLAFESLHETPLSVAGRLQRPAAPAGARMPAVVIVHGSSGIDSRGRAYAAALDAAGIASFEIDLWAPRGLKGNLDRPAHVAETLPDAFGALRALTRHPAIDPARIGIMGFSWGGIVSMLAATREQAERWRGDTPGFAAFAPLYPVCWMYNHRPGYVFRDLVGRPMLIQCGADDAYDKPGTPAALVASLPAADRATIELVVYPGATHAWDRGEGAVIVEDPLAHEGAGGRVPFTPNPDVTRSSLAATAAFFRKTLAA
jgi:dienelactone hydrolase